MIIDRHADNSRRLHKTRQVGVLTGDQPVLVQARCVVQYKPRSVEARIEEDGALSHGQQRQRRVKRLAEADNHGGARQQRLEAPQAIVGDPMVGELGHMRGQHARHYGALGGGIEQSVQRKLFRHGRQVRPAAFEVLRTRAQYEGETSTRG